MIDAWRRIDGLRPLVIFEAVGVPGMIEQAMRMAPKDARILVVGRLHAGGPIHPMVGIGRELNIQFALGYEPHEFAAALRSIADGRSTSRRSSRARSASTACRRRSTELADPEAHAKIMVEPG